MTNNPSLLIVEDDTRLCDMLADYLAGDGYSVQAAHTASKGMDMALATPYSAIILDIMLPDFDGMEFCKRLRSTSDTPIIMLTAKGDPFDRILGLELGADDYLPKPFEPRELLARIKAILRRGRAEQTNTDMTGDVNYGRLCLSSASLSVRLDGNKCDLTPYQFKLLAALAEQPGRVQSRDSLMNKLQGHNLDVFDRSIDVHISRIRNEIEDDPKKPRRIITVRGVGYLFSADQD